MVTCYDAWSAKLIDQSPIDIILVGDSAAMVMHGFDHTVHATLDMMTWHTSAVARVVKNTFILGDLPFCSYRKSLSETVTAAETLMRAGAHAIKLEGARGNLDSIRHLVDSGIPVMGHIGLTPQAVHAMGGYKVQGRLEKEANALKEDALKLQESGCFALVLECIPARLAEEITASLTIPTIGIGAGPHTDGQVLVLHDLLGFNPDFKAKFTRQYLAGHTLIQEALNQFHHEIQQAEFPLIPEHSF